MLLNCSTINRKGSERVSYIALRTLGLHKDKRNVPNLLPNTDELVKMKDYLEKRLATVYENGSSAHDALSLQKIFFELLYKYVIICRIILFNKRRSVEVA